VFQIKICGITSAEDARHAARAGADAVGINFYVASPRYVDPRSAMAIVEALPHGIVKTGVFVNATVPEVSEIAEALRLDLVQLHGDEPPELLRQLSDALSLPVMKVFRVGGGLDEVVAYLDACRELACLPRLVMFDASKAGGPHGSAYGGTGTLANWDLARRFALHRDLPPLVLAGGLSATNVADAIRTVRPAAVDVASGVEVGPGRKDPAQMTGFVAAARGAFDNL
jgi:phosphoribosylanthranilate isomerase